jgi:ABC-type glycerol-3-phosphate transport system permease component
MARIDALNPRSEPAAKMNWARLTIYIVLTVGAIIAVIPFLYMVFSSLRSYGSIITNNFWPWWPLGDEPLQLNNYPDAIQSIGFDKQWGVSLFVRYLTNSVIVSGLVVIGTLVTSILAAYVFAYINIPGKSVLFLLILATLMIPNDLTLVPKVVMMYNFKWYNNYLALTVPFFVSVFGIFLLRQFFMQIPKELFDAAVIDGASHLRYLISIVLPIASPAVITVALLNFIWTWDSFKWPLLVTRDSNMRVLAVGLQQFMVGEGGTKVHLMMAFATMVVTPVLVFYFFTQKFFTEGIARTGIKG